MADARSRPAPGARPIHAAIDPPIPRAKRALDVVGSATILLVLLPLLLVTATLVAVTSRGPILYRQRRIGHGGAWFTILKFRTMIDGADERIDLILADPRHREHYDRHGKLARDPRVTRLGRALRLLSIDELPQLWNVLRGDMSLVGPRPRWDADELARYGDALDDYLSARPGLTGPWQVSGRNRLADVERVALDVWYARTHRLSTDLRLLARTVPVLLWPFGRGAC